MHIAQLQQQNDVGFRRLRFSPELEPHYRRVRDKGIRERARPVCASALALFLLALSVPLFFLPIPLGLPLAVIGLLLLAITALRHLADQLAPFRENAARYERAA